MSSTYCSEPHIMIAYVNGGAACYRLEKDSRGVLLTSIFKPKKKWRWNSQW